MSLPKNPVKGQIYITKNPHTGRDTCFIATGKQGFGKFRIVKCPKGQETSKMAEKNPRVQSSEVWVPGSGWYQG